MAALETLARELNSHCCSQLLNTRKLRKMIDSNCQNLLHQWLQQGAALLAGPTTGCTKHAFHQCSRPYTKNNVEVAHRYDPKAMQQGSNDRITFSAHPASKPLLYPQLIHQKKLPSFHSYKVMGKSSDFILSNNRDRAALFESPKFQFLLKFLKEPSSNNIRLLSKFTHSGVQRNSVWSLMSGTWI